MISAKRKSPLAAAIIVRNIGITAYTFTGKTAVDYFCKLGVLNNPHRLAGVKGHTLSLAGALNTAVDRGICDRIS